MLGVWLDSPYGASYRGTPATSTTNASMAISRIAFVLLAITLLAACARRGPEYSVGGNPAVPAAQAERSLIERLLRRQISPPLDKPLTAVSVQLRNPLQSGLKRCGERREGRGLASSRARRLRARFGAHMAFRAAYAQRSAGRGAAALRVQILAAVARPDLLPHLRVTPKR
jgi:hypothetical protein